MTLNTIPIFPSPDLGMLLESILLFCSPYYFVKNSYLKVVFYSEIISQLYTNNIMAVIYKCPKHNPFKLINSEISVKTYYLLNNIC